MTTEIQNTVSVLTFMTLVATVVVYYLQLKAMQAQLTKLDATAKTQAMLSLIEHIQSPEVRSARQHIFSIRGKKPYDQWSDEDKAHASTACVAYHTLGVCVRAGIVDCGHFARGWGYSVTPIRDILR
jgi:hypothetical protein